MPSQTRSVRPTLTTRFETIWQLQSVPTPIYIYNDNLEYVLNYFLKQIIVYSQEFHPVRVKESLKTRYCMTTMTYCIVSNKRLPE